MRIVKYRYLLVITLEYIYFFLMKLIIVEKTNPLITAMTFTRDTHPSSQLKYCGAFTLYLIVDSSDYKNTYTGWFTMHAHCSLFTIIVSLGNLNLFIHSDLWNI